MNATHGRESSGCLSYPRVPPIASSRVDQLAKVCFDAYIHSYTHTYIREEADRRKLLEQLDQADKIMSDKINVIQQLEETLVAQSNQRERFRSIALVL